MKTLIRNSIFMAFFNIFGRASGMIRLFLLMAFLNGEEYSLVSFALYFGILCRHFTDGGLDNLVSRDGARDYEKLPLFYVNALFMKAVLAVLFCACAFGYLWGVREKSGYEIVIIYTALAGSIMTSFTGVIRSCFTAIERMEFVFYTNLPSRVISITLLFFVLWYALPIEWAVASISFENMLWFFLLGFISLRYFQLAGARLSLPVMRYIFWESLPLMAYGFFNRLYLSLDVFMIEYLMGQDALAPYTYASMLLEGILLLLSSYFVAVYPTLSRLYEADFEAYKRLFRRSFSMLCLFTIPVSVWIAFWSDIWLNLIIWTGSVPPLVLSILAMNLNLNMMNTLLIIVFTSSNQQRLLVFYTGFAVLVSFLSNVVLIHGYNQPGAAWASLLSQIALFVLMAIRAYRLFSLTYPWRKPLWLFALSILSAYLSHWIPGVNALVEPILFVVILGGLSYAAGIISRSEIQKIRTVFLSEKAMTK